jgi:hypothetical protein
LVIATINKTATTTGGSIDRIHDDLFGFGN